MKTYEFSFGRVLLAAAVFTAILAWQADRIEQLIAVASELCNERLERLQAEAN